MKSGSKKTSANKQGYCHPLGFGHRPALFISDMQNAYTNPDYPRGMDARKEIAVINKLLLACRKQNIPVFFSAIAFNPQQIEQPNLWMQKIPGLADLKQKTPSVEINKKIKVDFSHDKLIVKQQPSAFFSTSFVAQLNTQEIDTLIITGCSTSGCVRATAIDCMQYGFKPMVVEDAVADRWQDAHKQTLFELNAKYADVITSQDVLKYFTSRRKTHV